jgi:hypothetical protein
LLRGTGIVQEPGQGGILSGVGIIGGSDYGSLLPGIGNILQLDISIPASQLSPTSYNAIQYPPNAFLIDQGIDSHITTNSAGSEDGSLLSGIGNIIGPVTDGLLLGVGNSAKPAITNTLPNTGNIVESPTESHSKFLAVSTSKPWLKSHPSLKYFSQSEIEFENLNNVDFDSGDSHGSLLPGVGNILELGLSIPSSEVTPISDNPVTFPSNLFSNYKVVGTPIAPGQNLPVISNEKYIYGALPNEPINTGVDTETGNTVYLYSGSESIPPPSRPHNTHISPLFSSPVPTKDGVYVPTGTRHYRPNRSEDDYSTEVDKIYNTVPLGRIGEISKNFPVWPATHIFHTVESNKPLSPDENAKLQSVAHVDVLKSPYLHVESHKTATSSGKIETANVENVKAIKIDPFNGISHVEVLNSHALLDTEALNQVPQVDHTFQHTIVSTSKQRGNEYKVYQPENDFSLKYLHYKKSPYSKDRSLEVSDHSHEIVENTGNEVGLEDRATDESESYYGKLQSARDLSLVNNPSLLHIMKNSEYDDRDITDKAHNIDFAERNTELTVDKIGTLFPKQTENKDALRSERKLSMYSVPGNEEDYFKRELFYERPHEEYISENGIYLHSLPTFSPEEIYMKDGGKEEQISFHELKIPVQEKDFEYLDISHKEEKSVLSYDTRNDENDSYHTPKNTENFQTNSLDDTSNAYTVIRSYSELKSDNAGVADATSDNKAYLEGNSSYHSTLTFEEAPEEKKGQMHLPDTHSNVNHELVENHVTYTSGHVTKVTFVPPFSTDSTLSEKYYEIPPSNILIPQYSIDTATDTYEDITSPKHTRLNNETTASSLIQNGSREALLIGTPIPYVSDLWEKSSLNDVFPVQEEVVISESHLMSHSRVSGDEDPSRYSEILIFPHWEAWPHDDISQSTETEDSLSFISNHEVSTHGVESQPYYFQKPHYDLEARSQDSRSLSHLTNIQYNFPATQAYLTFQPHSGEIQSQPSGLEQNHEPHLFAEDQETQPPLSLLSTPRGIDNKNRPHSTPEGREVQTHPYVSDKNKQPYLTPPHEEIESKPHPLHHDVETDTYVLSHKLKSDLIPTAREVEPLSHSEYLAIELQSHVPDDRLNLMPKYHDGVHQVYLSNHQLDQHTLTKSRGLEPSSYILGENHGPELTTYHDAETHTLLIKNEPKVNLPNYAEPQPPLHHELEPQLTSLNHESQPHPNTLSYLESDSTPVYGGVEPHSYNPKSNFPSPHQEKEIEQYLEPQANSEILHEAKTSLSLNSGADSHIESYEDESYSVTPLYEHKQITILNEGIALHSHLITNHPKSSQETETYLPDRL